MLPADGAEPVGGEIRSEDQRQPSEVSLAQLRFKFSGIDTQDQGGQKADAQGKRHERAN